MTEHMTAESELEMARETIRRLNRRCQSAEAGLAEKVNANAGRSLGRAFANAAATMYEAQLEEARASLAHLQENALTPEEARVIVKWCDYYSVAEDVMFGKTHRAIEKLLAISASEEPQ
jgi:hypothetical protein